MGRTVFVMAVLLMLAAMSLVSTRYQSRLLFITNEQLVSQSNELEVVWRHLQLKRADLSRNARIHQIARDTLNMHVIAPARTIYVREEPVRPVGGVN